MLILLWKLLLKGGCIEQDMIRTRRIGNEASGKARNRSACA